MRMLLPAARVWMLAATAAHDDVWALWLADPGAGHAWPDLAETERELAVACWERRRLARLAR